MSNIGALMVMDALGYLWLESRCWDFSLQWNFFSERACFSCSLKIRAQQWPWKPTTKARPKVNTSRRWTVRKDRTCVMAVNKSYSMVQSPSWAADWLAASQEIPRISRNPKVHYRTHKRTPPVPIPINLHNEIHAWIDISLASTNSNWQISYMSIWGATLHPWRNYPHWNQ